MTELLPTYSLEELNGIGHALGRGSRVVVVTGPSTMTKPTEASILATAKEVEAREIKAYDDAAPTVPLMTSAPPAGAVTTTRTVPEIGVTEWTLKNGVRVIVTTFADGTTYVDKACGCLGYEGRAHDSLSCPTLPR